MIYFGKENDCAEPMSESKCFLLASSFPDYWVPVPLPLMVQQICAMSSEFLAAVPDQSSWSPCDLSLVLAIINLTLCLVY
jgi:hypothetical protein